MNLKDVEIVDPTLPLSNEAHENFVQAYISFDLDGIIKNKRARKMEAYRVAYPETRATKDSIVNSRATDLLLKESIAERLEYLYEKFGTSVENKYSWTPNKAEEALLDIIYGEEEKSADKIKAISELNRMRGIDKPQVEENVVKEESKIGSFFDKILGGK